jgi:hypothetical protein
VRRRCKGSGTVTTCTPDSALLYALPPPAGLGTLAGAGKGAGDSEQPSSSEEKKSACRWTDNAASRGRLVPGEVRCCCASGAGGRSGTGRQGRGGGGCRAAILCMCMYVCRGGSAAACVPVHVPVELE